VNHIADFGNGNDGDFVDRHLRNFTQSISLRGSDFEPESIHITAKHHRQKANHDAGVPPPLSSNLTSVAAPATAAGHREGRRRPPGVAAKHCSILQKCRRNRRLWPCKVLGSNRTKVFHVKHFGTIDTAAIRLVR
jgi:hypothetical protein